MISASAPPAPTTARPATAAAPATPPHRRHRHALVVVGLMVLAAALRLPTLRRAYWVDEGISVGIASHPLADLPHLLRQDGSPPLWYVLLHGWMAAFGSSPASTHTLSLIVSVLVVPLAWWAGRRLFGPAEGICVAALAATNPFLNWYATETRMYTLVIALGLVALTAATLAARQRSPTWAVAAAVSFAALDYTHNWGLYLTAATAVFLVARGAVTRDRRLVGGTILTGAAVVVLYLPWLPSFLVQATTTAAPWAIPPGLGDFFADPSTTIGGTLGFLVAPVLVVGAILTRRSRSGRSSQTATLLVVVAVLTTVGGWSAAHLDPSWTVRYLAVTVPAWLLAAGGALGAGRGGRRTVAAVCVGLAAWSVAGSLWPNVNAAYAKDNAAAVAAAAAPDLAPGDLVVVTQTEQMPVVAYYLPAGLAYFDPMGRVTDPDVVDWSHLLGHLESASACRSLEPAIAALPVGAKVLEIDPLTPVGASGSAWSIAAHRQVVAVDHLLGYEPSLRAVRSFTEGTSPQPYSPVIGELFVKDHQATTCD